MALVLLWSLGVHEQAHREFDEAMEAIAPSEFHAAPGIKGFERSFEKAKEYAVEKGLEGDEVILAGLHVIDGLRCSFTVGTIARNLEIGSESFAARIKPQSNRPLSEPVLETPDDLGVKGEQSQRSRAVLS